MSHNPTHTTLSQEMVNSFKTADFAITGVGAENLAARNQGVALSKEINSLSTMLAKAVDMGKIAGAAGIVTAAATSLGDISPVTAGVAAMTAAASLTLGGKGGKGR